MRQPSIQLAWEDKAAGRLAAAEEACLKILGQDGADSGALHLLGLLRFDAGRTAEGMKLLEQAVAGSPGSAATQHDLGLMLLMLGAPEQAEPPLRVAVALEPGNPEAQLNLGNALHAQGQLPEAEECYRLAFGLDPRRVRTSLSLGNLLCQVRRPREALPYLSGAATLAPEAAQVHSFLGNAFRDLGQTEDAVQSYGRALAIEPDNSGANESLGTILKARNEFGGALNCFQKSDSHYARAQALECLLRLGRPADFFDAITQSQDQEASNLESAALSAYAAFHLERQDPHPFCPAPLQCVKVIDKYTGSGGDAQFLRDLIREASQLQAIWEPRGVSTTGGFQTAPSLFFQDAGALGQLHRDLQEELERYRQGLQHTNAALYSRWPKTIGIYGWYVRLLTGGHQSAHNHPSGWVAGCLYLQMPKAMVPGEGAIEFGLDSGAYPKLSDKQTPTLLHNPKAGQLVLFPSSLYHRTIPFSSDVERLSIAFDLSAE